MDFWCSKTPSVSDINQNQTPTHDPSFCSAECPLSGFPFHSFNFKGIRMVIPPTNLCARSRWQNVSDWSVSTFSGTAFVVQHLRSPQNAWWLSVPQTRCRRGCRRTGFIGRTDCLEDCNPHQKLWEGPGGINWEI